ncbi:peptidase [Gracilimonas mengyeensis]|uniref:Pregnancy-associated plasma protein-A n=1 Tax=Gracilimonas mengyeensis TaxID=1302730 RepID=A0A521DF05_9BACT|nr:peptidase [Gracilimonas mengyeensis]SMO70243.1 hypothetical protein SAMN06265219_108116 [Gracilimonas mengyeensis]
MNYYSRRFLNSFLLLILGGLVFVITACDGDPASSGNNDDLYSNTLSPGLSAHSFLSDSTFIELVVEIDYMPGHSPNQEALNNLQTFLEQRLNKQSVTILAPQEIPAAGNNNYSANDIRSLEEDHRNEFSEDDKLAAYMLITDGYFENNNVLGVAYYNTSTAFFGAAYDDATSGFGAPSDYQIQATSFRHEFGHLFGLVNISNSGTEMQTNHQDAEHGNHCTNENCLMYYAMERPDLVEQFFGSQVPSLDANCLADLQANGGQ